MHGTGNLDWWVLYRDLYITIYGENTLRNRLRYYLRTGCVFCLLLSKKRIPNVFVCTEIDVPYNYTCTWLLANFFLSSQQNRQLICTQTFLLSNTFSINSWQIIINWQETIIVFWFIYKCIHNEEKHKHGF